MAFPKQWRKEAEQARIWAVVAAYHVGLSIRPIAAVPGLSRSRIHQRLQDDETRAIPTWRSHLRTLERAADSGKGAVPPQGRRGPRLPPGGDLGL